MKETKNSQKKTEENITDINAISNASKTNYEASHVETRDAKDIASESEFVPVEHIFLQPQELVMQVGTTLQMSVVIEPENATNKNVRFVSLTEDIVSVDETTGVVTAINIGDAQIEVYAQDGSGVSNGCWGIIFGVDVVEATVESNVYIDTVDNYENKLRDEYGMPVTIGVNDFIRLYNTTTINSNGITWYQVLYDDMIAYVKANSFIKTETPHTHTVGICDVRVNSTSANLNVRSSPFVKSNNSLGQFSHGTTLKLTSEFPQNENWYAVYGKTNNGTYTYGWCSGDYLEKEVECGTLVDASSLNIRQTTDGNSSSLGTISRGTTVQVLEKNYAFANNYTWHKVLYNNKVGYVVAGNNTPNFSFSYQWRTITKPNNILPASVSNSCVDFIKSYEDFRGTPYTDSSGVLTIGYGHVIKDGESFTSITQAEGEELLMEDIASRLPSVIYYCNQKLASWNQNQFDALFSLLFNAGGVNMNTVMNNIISGEDPYDAFGRIVYSGGNFSLGLYRRRMDEADIFVNGEYVREYPAAPANNT